MGEGFFLRSDGETNAAAASGGGVSVTDFFAAFFFEVLVLAFFFGVLMLLAFFLFALGVVVFFDVEISCGIDGSCSLSKELVLELFKDDAEESDDGSTEILYLNNTRLFH